MLKKIAFVTNGLYLDSDFSTGGVKLNYLLVKELYNKGYVIDLYADSVELTHSYMYNDVYSFHKIEDNRDKYDFILSDMACVKSDITYIHSHSYPYRIEMCSNNFKHFFYKYLSRSHHKRRLDDFYRIKSNLRDTKYAVVSSEVLKKDVVKNYEVKPENICIIPPPIEKVEEISPKINNIFTFGISALGFEHKGGYLMLKAIRDLSKKYKNIKVKIIYPSDNLYVKFLVKMYNIRKYCEFLPIQKDMNKFYSSIDCLCVPSLLETFGMVASEALNVGTPVIIAKHCGASDYVQSGVNGFVYEAKKKSYKELVVAMEKMLNTNKIQRYHMQKEAIKSVENLNLENFIEAYYNLINKL